MIGTRMTTHSHNRLPAKALHGPTRALIAFAISLSITIICISCITSRPPNASPYLDVPFRYQTGNQCGAAALDMVLQYNGVLVQWNRIKSDVYLPALKGTTPGLIADAAQTYGLKASVTHGTIHQLRSWLNADIAPILFYRTKSGINGHFVVVTGIGNTTNYFIHSKASRNKNESHAELIANWGRGDFTAIIIQPTQKEMTD